MSINTATKRRYAASILPIHKAPIPSSAVDVAWRATVAWIYAGNFYSTFTITINGIAIQWRKGSLLIEERIEERSIAEFTVVDVDGVASYQRGQPVIIYDAGTEVVFGGVIDTPEKVAMAPSGGLFHPIRCTDWHYLADKRLIAESYLATAAGTIVEDIRVKYLAAEGITVGRIEAGPDIKEAVFPYVTASDALDALAVNSAKIWFINQYKKLYFQARDISPAPWTADLTHKIDDCRLSSGNPKYRNRQYIRGGKGTTIPQTETFVADGEQVAFTVAFPLAQTPSGATGSIKEDLGADKTIGIKGIDEAREYYWSKGDPTVYAAAAPAANVEVQVIYNGLFNIITLVEDAAEIANQLAIEGSGTGFVDDIADEPTLTLKQASFDSGQAKLAKFGVAGKQFTYQTIKPGLEVGQIQTVNYPLLGLNNAEMLIESIETRIIGKIQVYNIAVTQGPMLGSWTRLFKALADMKSEVIERLNVGSEQILIILVPLAENWGWAETITKYPNICIFPAVDRYPATTIFPC